MSNLDYEYWEPLSLKETCELLQDLQIPWWIAGGYALELFVGESYRPHGDIDILIRRKDQWHVQQHLADWELWRATLPGLKMWGKGEFLEGKIKDIWCRPHTHAPWQLQVMLFDTERDHWIYKRDPKIRGNLADMYKVSAEGIRYLAPEIQLLYKAKYVRAKDQIDFDRVIPLLDEKALKWLYISLLDQYPEGHLWISTLRLSGRV